MIQSDIINNNFNKVLKCIKSSNAYITDEVLNEEKCYTQIYNMKHNSTVTSIDVIKDNDYTVIGSPVISADGTVSSYSKNNAIKANISATPTTSLKIKSSYTWNTDESATLDNICVPYVLGTNRWRLDFRITDSTLSVYCTNDLDTSTNTKFNIPITDLPANNAKVKVEEIITKTNRTVNVTINGTTYTGTTTFASEQVFEQIQLTLGNASLTGDSDYLWCGTQDLNEFLVYVDDNIVYQPCLIIPYTQSKTGSKIVDAVYRDRVIDLYEQTGVASYYTLDETNQNYTLPMGEIYGMINAKQDVGDIKSAMPIGTIYPLVCTADYIPVGSLPCDGGEYSKEQFNDLWNNYLTATTPLLLTCTYDEYASDITAYGQCGKFAVDSVNNKFKVPTIKDGAYITQAKSDTELGKSYNESLPNLKGSYNSIIAKNGIVPSGAFSDSVASGTTRKYSLGESYTFDIGNILDFNASNSSSTYQDNAKVQGDNVRMRYFVVVASGSVNESQMNWSEWASGLQGKSNTDLSNLSETGKKAIDGQWVSSPYLLSSATATGTYTIDLSSYLPSDNYTYEVILNIKTYHTTVCNVTVYANDFPPFEFSSKTYMSDIGQYARSQANTFLIPVSQKQVLMKIGTNNASENYLSMIAYRRVGTNV